jgi:GxxExxY protein
MNIEEITDTVRQTGFETHVYFKNGFLEKVYENAVANRLRKKGVQVVQQHPLSVYDEDGMIVGEYVADLLVEGVVIVELKAVRAIDNNHYAQVLAYLKASKMKHGMLMNFGAPKFQVKKFIL